MTTTKYHAATTPLTPPIVQPTSRMSCRKNKLHPDPHPRMKPRSLAPLLLVAALLAAPFAAPQLARAQAADIPSAATPQAAGTADQRGRALIDQMIAALGGDAWRKRTTMQSDGRTSTFFHGEPNPYTTDYHELRRFAPSGSADADRIGFLTDRGMILPGKKIDVVQIWTDGHGYEITYKGKAELPKKQVDDYYRQRAHSIEEVVAHWINAPGVMIVAEGSKMVERRLADKVTVLTATNDAVTFDLDSATHLPVRSTFQWRNPEFNDFDEEAETYDDYHTIQGLPTPLTLTRYHNGDMVSQRFLSKVTYNLPADPSLFDLTVLTRKSEVKKSK
jgi:hypothetical protein